MSKSGGASRSAVRSVAERKARPARAAEAASTSSQPVYSAYRVRQDSRGFFHVEGQPTAGGAWHDVGKAHATQAIAERALKTRATKDAKLSGQRAATRPANVQQVATYSRNRNATRTEATPATPAKAASPARARSGAAATMRNQDNAQARAIERQVRASQARTAPTRALEQQIRDLQAHRRTTNDPAERARIAQRINELGDEWARSKESATPANRGTNAPRARVSGKEVRLPNGMYVSRQEYETEKRRATYGGPVYRALMKHGSVEVRSPTGTRFRIERSTYPVTNYSVFAHGSTTPAQGYNRVMLHPDTLAEWTHQMKVVRTTSPRAKKAS